MQRGLDAVRLALRGGQLDACVLGCDAACTTPSRAVCLQLLRQGVMLWTWPPGAEVLAQDIAGVTQASLREGMGVVPQDTVCACPQGLPSTAA